MLPTCYTPTRFHDMDLTFLHTIGEVQFKVRYGLRNPDTLKP